MVIDWLLPGRFDSFGCIILLIDQYVLDDMEIEQLVKLKGSQLQCPNPIGASQAVIIAQPGLYAFGDRADRRGPRVGPGVDNQAFLPDTVSCSQP
jgi:hypothetical protein